MKVQSPQGALFVPLRREFFEAFAAGQKDTEYRPYGPRWNERTCPPGRSVVLSLGYGRQHRLKATVIRATIHDRPQELPGWTECYGERHARALCIRLEVQSEPRA